MKKQLAKLLPIIIVFVLLISSVGCKSTNDNDDNNYSTGISKVETNNDESTLDDNNADAGEYIRCPDFVGMSVSEVEEHEYYKDYTIRFTFEHKESEYDISQICEQSIEPKSKIKKGTVITLYISSGQNEMVIPNVYFMDELEAKNTMVAKGFKILIKKIASENVTQGKVIRTDPAIGTKVTRDQLVTLYVSSGVPEKLIAMPDVIGITRPVAISKLETSGFTVKTVMTYNESYDNGFVFDTNPAPGTQLAKGSMVTIYISRGKNVDTPPVVDDNSDDVDIKE